MNELLWFFQLASILADRTPTAKCENTTIFRVFPGKAFLVADRLVNPEGAEWENQVTETAFFTFDRADTGKVARVKAYWTAKAIQADLNVPTATQQRVELLVIHRSHFVKDDRDLWACRSPTDFVLTRGINQPMECPHEDVSARIDDAKK
jgi:hypothetical protein